jgi:hypothetical protein
MTSEWADAVERDDSMDDVNYHTREVYANLGACGLPCAGVGVRRSESPHSC